jgi:hypothetical protein
MNQKELQLLITTGQVASIYLTFQENGYEVWAYPDDSGSFPHGLGNQLRETARGRKPRTWQDLSRAFDYVHGLGWKGPITVENSAR